ncbi:MAG: TerB family tellurite resistance protein [Rhodobacteraceae bacterium]|nr:TerB family tellurite resistance protein [Paracoccaceae bacterium]
MFAKLLSQLTQPEPNPLDDGDARLALTALLVRVAKSDGYYDAEERSRILSIATQRYGLTGAAADALVKDAETLDSEAPDTVRFTRAIKDAVPYEERMGVIEALWSIVLADGVRDDEENALLRLVANLLGVNDRDSNIARRAAEASG